MMRVVRILWLCLATLPMMAQAGEYGQLCVLDTKDHEDFPILDDRKLLAMNLKQSRNSDSDLDDVSEEEGYVTMYKCICDEIILEDVRTTSSYCPIDFICAIPMSDGPAECVDMKVFNGIARMAWPVFLVSAACLVTIFVASFYGLSLIKYVSKHCCCKKQEDRDRIEQDEVDELLRVSRLDPPPERPPRKRIAAFQVHQYNAKILESATLVWRREWKNYRRTHKDLYLRTRIYSSGDIPTVDSSSRTNSTNEADSITKGSSSDEEEVPVESNQTAVVVSNADEAEALDLEHKPSSDETTCSICIAAIESGERVADLRCGHLFHAPCLKEWIGTAGKNTCPLCNATHIASRERGESISSTGENAV